MITMHWRCILKSICSPPGIKIGLVTCGIIGRGIEYYFEGIVDDYVVVVVDGDGWVSEHDVDSGICGPTAT
ncbi:hypothetical protein TSUD_379340 [Trifolium subterraneum]|uniref:Uncharacterized protein n=1 Tax=Trifolium subterraneum TaxID=3900 RepID=A0A2Z6NDL0_TRISU|nr:hypothetical protein TSUD_379340 [Trifolium subterraneum]